MDDIFCEFALSPSITLKNKIVMAPMTRRFAEPEGIPSPLMAPYYAKRSGSGLIITEGTLISTDAIGYGNVPGIYNEECINAWKKITDSVHKNNGVIFCQLWHCGRVSHRSFHNNKLPISASKTSMDSPLGNSGYYCSESRAATTKEIAEIINDFSVAAKNAIYSGFDGVEIHAANGYLIDQFLHACTNIRNDLYGGTPENRARFCLDIVDKCANTIGSDKIGVRISPAGHMAEIKTSSQDHLTFKFLLDELQKKRICYVHTGNFNDAIIHPELDNQTMTNFIRSNFNGNVIASGSYTLESALEFIKKDKKNLIAFGRPFIANPDLIEKIKSKIPWKCYSKKMLNTL